MEGKDTGMTVLSNRPWNVEAPAHLLDDPVTPTDRMFIRNNGLIPEETIDPAKWTLTINGESVNESRIYTIEDLKTRFKTHTYQLVLECGGNRSEEHTSELQSLMRISYAVFCLKKKTITNQTHLHTIKIQINRKVNGH